MDESQYTSVLPSQRFFGQDPAVVSLGRGQKKHNTVQAQTAKSTSDLLTKKKLRKFFVQDPAIVSLGRGPKKHHGPGPDSQLYLNVLKENEAQTLKTRGITRCQ
jgi:hypothetical protein